MTIPNRTYGVELELSGLRPNDAARHLQNAGIDAHSEGYNHYTRNHWKVVTDASVISGCEVVSPILRGEDGIEQIRKVCQALAPYVRINRSCGLHLHVGTDGMTGNDVAMVLARYARFETTIDAFMPQSRRSNNNSFCRSIQEMVSSRIVNRSFRDIRAVASSMGGERYLKINMTSHSRYGTMEFRQHSGTCNANKVEHWVRFILGFVEASIGQTPEIEVQPGTVVDGPAPRPRTPRLNGIVRKLDRVIRAFREAPRQRLSIEQIALAGGWSLTSVPPYVTRLRQERGCVIRKVRGTNDYVLIGNTGRLSTDPVTNNTATTVETQQAARRVRGIGDIADDSVYRGIPAVTRQFYEERTQDLRLD